MKRDFLESLGLEKDVVDKILAENGNDIEREKAKTTQAKADLADIQQQLSERLKETEELKKTSGDAAEWQKRHDELLAKYETETKDLQGKITLRERTDAVEAFIAEKGLKFTSKSAKASFVNALLAKEFEIADGKPSIGDDFLREQQTADPEAFAPEKPAVRIVGSVGVGSAPAQEKSRASVLASKYQERLYGAANKNSEG